MSVITRFAPSPTGNLHIGSARTALFNYLYSRRHGGKFLLRVEDTDKGRSKKKFLESILDGLQWLGINYDDQIIYQSDNQNKHLAIAQRLLELGQAYYCYMSKEEIDQKRDKALSKKESFVFDSPYRHGDLIPDNSLKPVIRLKTPHDGQVILNDMVQGEVKIDSADIEDTILVRSDNSPTYMLAVVADDIDMGITHIIRGVDHLTNSFRQCLIYNALGQTVPVLSHIPLIHGQDGAKLSKRHGATSVLEYKEMGYLPEAIINNLLRLGWSHGDDEIILLENAKKWFNLENIGKSAAKFDTTKLDFLNSYYIKGKDDGDLMIILKDMMPNCSNKSYSNIMRALPSIKTRAKTLNKLANIAKLYIDNYEIQLSEEQINILQPHYHKIIQSLINDLERCDILDNNSVQIMLKSVSEKYSEKFGNFMKIVRLLLTGLENTPSIFEMISIIGTNETIRRLKIYR